MKIFHLVFAFILITLCGCGPSSEDKKLASENYAESISVIKSVNSSDSAYVDLIQNLLQKIQEPDLNKNKQKHKILADSINLLDRFYDSLYNKINIGISNIEKYKSENHSMSIITEAETLLTKYNSVAENNYKLINKKMKEISFPVKDIQYAKLLKLSYDADSTLNSAISTFNKSSNSFCEKYSLNE